MVSIEKTIDVPVDVYSHAVPEWFTGDTVPIKITAFADKVYLDFPRWQTFERKVQSYIKKDSIIHGDGELYPIDRSDIQTYEDALEICLKVHTDGEGTEYIPTNTSQFCADGLSIFRATVRIEEQWDSDQPAARPVLRRLGVMDSYRDNDTVSTQLLRDEEIVEPPHQRLVDIVSGYIYDIKNDGYWNGYKRGVSEESENITWTDVAWKKFKDEWPGDQELLMDVGEWMAAEGMTVCRRTDAFFPIPEWSRPTGSYVNTISDVFDGKCPECGADKSEHWKRTSTSNSTRVPDRYKCTKCGHTAKGITTG